MKFDVKSYIRWSKVMLLCVLIEALAWSIIFWILYARILPLL